MVYAVDVLSHTCFSQEHDKASQCCPLKRYITKERLSHTFVDERQMNNEKELLLNNIILQSIIMFIQYIGRVLRQYEYVCTVGRNLHV